jgi:phage tail-like protein
LGLFQKKYPIKISVTTLTLSRGVTKIDSGFYRWILNCLDGSGYRSNIIINQYHRSDVGGLKTFSQEKASRTINCYHCFPVRYKPSGDFDAASSDISIEELELDVEYFTVEQT